MTNKKEKNTPLSEALLKMEKTGSEVLLGIFATTNQIDLIELNELD